MSTRVAIVTLGCARNEVDSEELAARLSKDGIELVQEPSDADAVLVNTCGFIEAAKKDSIDTLLAANDLKQNSNVKAVLAVGCMAERYGNELEKALPEADAILGFDDYDHITAKVNDVLNGRRPAAPIPQDRRLLLPISPTARSEQKISQPLNRFRLDDKATAPLKLASGCDRRCTFCAIPRFRGSYLSRRPAEILEEAAWLGQNGVKELFLVSENTTSFGKDLGDIRLLETLLPEIAKISEIEWIRLSYLQPAEMRPSLIEAVIKTPKVVPYFDLSFQHAHPDVLRRMKRFGGTKDFLNLINSIRKISPTAGIRSNFIVGFPGETENEFAEIQNFLEQAQLDAIGIFGYSVEDGTEAANFSDTLAQEVVDERVKNLNTIAQELMSQRAHQRIGEDVEVLVEASDEDGLTGRIMQQGPEVDGITTILDSVASVGELVKAVVVGSVGADLEVKTK
ncbi:MAG: 30S ribosomal protein S12 methylthiotransferase RimO [Candidatus Nanopelagicales bacterium]|nr:30S ribosomal protein S12 methylthiotransferase RimO [Candidatus Nanopelagicales bacterium]MDP5107499.1 30S ribosomal protein S12 methylthiotransferase RimO [Candidatus Nanopelagicales bacterium]